MDICEIQSQSKLATTPKAVPSYPIEVTNRVGQSETLADPRATRCLVALMNQHAVAGGAAAHWGGPAAFAEIMSSLHAIMFRSSESQWFEQYNFVNDAGHTENGIYALRALYQFDNLTFDDLKGFRSIKSKLTGHGEAHLNPQGVYISNGPLGSGLAQAQGLAMADKLTGKSRVTICTMSDGGCMEGEAKEALCSIPGLAFKGRMNPFVLVISDNNTKLSGRIDHDSFSMQHYFEGLEHLGWYLLKLEEGHDIQKVHLLMEEAIELAQKQNKPICVWAKTIKGKGVSSTEESSSGGHGHPLKAHDPKIIEFIQEIYQGCAPQEFLAWAEELTIAPEQKKQEKKTSSSAVASEKVQPGFARAAIDAVKKGLPVVSISADLQGSTGIADFHKQYPERSFDLGIAESNMVSAAIGLSKQGLIPIVDTFAQFGITKGNLPLIMSALSQGPVIALFSHTGFQDAADGASHQATTYFAALSAIPHTQVISCSCSSEAYAFMKMAIEKFESAKKAGKQPDSIVFFFGRENHPVSYLEQANYQWQKSQVLKEGDYATVLTTGPMLTHALKAAEILAQENIHISVINEPFINRSDIETLKDQLSKTHSRLITLEDHQIVGGLGAQVCHALSLQGIHFQVKSIGNPGQFGQSAYKADHLYAKYKMDFQAVVDAVKSF